MAGAERVSVTWLQKPAELPVRRWPKHEVRDGLGPDSIGNSAAACRAYPHRTYAGFKLHGWRQIKRLLEYKIRIPFGLSAAKQGLNAGLYFEPILDRRKFDRRRRAEAGASAVEAPFSRRAKLNDSKRVLILRQCRPGNQQKGKRLSSRERAEQSNTFGHELSSCQDSNGYARPRKAGDEQFRQTGKAWAGALKEQDYSR